MRSANGASGGGVRAPVDLAVDGLEPERAHPDPVRAGIAERDPRRGLLVQRAALDGEAVADRLQKVPAHSAGDSKVQTPNAPVRRSALPARLLGVAPETDLPGAGGGM